MKNRTFRGYPIVEKKDIDGGLAFIIYSRFTFDQNETYKVYTKKQIDGVNVANRIACFCDMKKAIDCMNGIN